MNTKTNPNDIIAAYVKYIDKDGGKRRPVLVLDNGDKKISVLKITSQYDSKSLRIKKNYYPLKDWKLEGLKKQSWVDVNQLMRIDKSISNFKKIGKLSSQDIKGLKDFTSDVLSKEELLKRAILLQQRGLER